MTPLKQPIKQEDKTTEGKTSLSCPSTTYETRTSEEYALEKASPQFSPLVQPQPLTSVTRLPKQLTLPIQRKINDETHKVFSSSVTMERALPLESNKVQLILFQPMGIIPIPTSFETQVKATPTRLLQQVLNVILQGIMTKTSAKMRTTKEYPKGTQKK